MLITIKLINTFITRFNYCVCVMKTNFKISELLLSLHSQFSCFLTQLAKPVRDNGVYITPCFLINSDFLSQFMKQ